TAWSGVMNVPVSDELVRNPHGHADEQDHHVDLERQAEKDRDPQLDSHERVEQRFLQSRRALDVRYPMAAPVDEARDAPEGQQPVKNQVDEQATLFTHGPGASPA